MSTKKCACGKTNVDWRGRWLSECCWRDPNAIMKSYLHQEHALTAERHWQDGFRPIWAMDVQAGDEIMYQDTMFGFPAGGHKTSTILEVDLDGLEKRGGEYYGVRFKHTGGSGEAEEDEGTECWVRRPGWT